MNSQHKQQPLKLPPRAEGIARLRALHDKITTTTATAAATRELTATVNDPALKAATDAFEVGDRMQDGTIYAGLTADGTQEIYAMPADLDVMMTFNEAAKRVENLNAAKYLGHADWQIPSLEQLKVLQQNQDKGSLKGTFTKIAANGSGYPVWYWSSTEDRVDSSGVFNVRFSDGEAYWKFKDNGRRSCRPVRLGPVR